MSCAPKASLVVVAAAFAAVLLNRSAALAGDELRGRARVLAADTIAIAGMQVRLNGIRVPPPSQRCRIGDRTYDCGTVAADALRDLTTGANVRCIRRGATATGQLIATCFADGYDMSEGMVYTGRAAAEPDSGGRYMALERQARAVKRGLWRGGFTAE